MNIKSKTLLLLSAMLSFGLGGCYDDMHQKMPRGPWKTESKRHSYFETVQVAHASRDGVKLRGLVGKANLDTPIYARILVNAPITKAPHFRGRVTKIQNALTDLGIMRHRIEVRYADPASAASMNGKDRRLVTVVVDQYEIIPPECPGWQEYMDTGAPPEGEANFGCTNERNFAAMIAEPKDIFEASQLAKADGARGARQIERYRTDKITNLKVEKSSLESKSNTETQNKETLSDN